MQFAAQQGTTRQGQKVCLTISPNRKAIRQYSFGGRLERSAFSKLAG